MQVVGTTSPLKVQNLFQVLDFFLKLLDEGIVLGTDLVGAHFRHDLLGSVCEL